MTATREELTMGLAVDAVEELTLFRTLRGKTARIVRALSPNALSRQAVPVSAGDTETTRTVAVRVRYQQARRTPLGIRSREAATAGAGCPPEVLIAGLESLHRGRSEGNIPMSVAEAEKSYARGVRLRGNQLYLASSPTRLTGQA